MSLIDRGKEIVDLVAVVGLSTLPSPARRCPLQFNPFLDPDRNRRFLASAYYSEGKFQRVVMEESKDIFPSSLHFRQNISVTTSGESAWELNSLPSLPSDAYKTVNSTSRRSSVVPVHGMPSYAEDLMESALIAANDKETTCDEANAVSSQAIEAHFIDSNQASINPAYGPEVGPQPESPRSATSVEESNAIAKSTVAEGLQVIVDGKLKDDVKQFRTQRERSYNASPTSATKSGDRGGTPSSQFVRKISPDLKEGLVPMKRLDNSPNDSETRRTAKFEGNGSPRSDMKPGEDSHNDGAGADKERNLSKARSLRKLLALGKSGSEDSPSRKNSLRNLLRKTSKTLRLNMLDGGKQPGGDVGRMNKSRELHVPNTAEEREPVSKGKRSTLPDRTTPKRDVEEAAKAGGGPTPEASDNDFEKIIMKQALHVEKYLDDLVSP